MISSPSKGEPHRLSHSRFENEAQQQCITERAACGAARQAVQLVGVLKRWPRLVALRLPHTGVYNQSLLEVCGACFLRGLTALDLSSSFVFDWCPPAPRPPLTGLSHVHSCCKGFELL